MLVNCTLKQPCIITNYHINIFPIRRSFHVGSKPLLDKTSKDIEVARRLLRKIETFPPKKQILVKHWIQQKYNIKKEVSVSYAAKNIHKLGRNFVSDIKARLEENYKNKNIF